MDARNNRKDVEARAEKLKSLMMCPICNKFMKNVTTICECLHSFCRKCIYKKITQEKLHSCPVCDIDLGCAPLEKLREDHNLQDIRSKIISVRRKAKANDILSGEKPLLQLPVSGRRKERSLSSLVSGPKSSNRYVITGRRKLPARKARGSTSFISEESIHEKVKDHLESSISLTTPSKNALYKNQHSSAAKLSKQHLQSKDEDINGMADLWKPLNCLVEAARMTKCSKSNPQRSGYKSAPSSIHVDETNLSKCNVNEFSGKTQAQYAEDEPIAPSGPKGYLKKIHCGRPKKAAADDEFKTPAQVVLNAANNECQRRDNPIWIMLVASDNQEGCVPLRQMPSCYLMIKDVNVSVSVIQKYIVKKLDLDSETEVEIYLQGQLLRPNLQLHSLLHLWCQLAPTSEKITTYVGNSAEELVMVLYYGRRA